jgi:hypothetical protein
MTRVPGSASAGGALCGSPILREGSSPVATRHLIGYTEGVVKSLRHRGLKRFFETGDGRKLQPKHTLIACEIF